MIKKLSNSNQSSSEMTSNQSDIYLVEAFLEENFLFRRNLLSGKTEFAVVSEDNDQALTWNVFTKEDLNTIVRKAKKLGLGGNGSPRQDIEEYIGSNHNLFVNIDELANMGPSQQGKLKQTLSKVKVNGRPIFGKSQADRPRYASFLATTNDEHPLCDPTGSRRFICIRIPAGAYIDNASPIDYAQLYAQVIYELKEQSVPYWFTNDMVTRIQECNYPYFKTDDMEVMLKACFQAPQGDGGKWMLVSEIFDSLHRLYPMLISDHRTKIRIGQAMRFLGCDTKRTNRGQAYLLVSKYAA